MQHRVVILKNSELICAGSENLEQAWAHLQAGTTAFSKFGEEYCIADFPEDVYRNLEAVCRERALQGQDYAALLPVMLGRRLLTHTDIDRQRCLAIIGSSRGPSQKLNESYQSFFTGQRLPAKTSPYTTAGTLSSLLSRSLGLSGLNFSLSAACSSGIHAIGVASVMLRSGVADFALAGGSEFAANEFSLSMLSAARVLARDWDIDFPHRPFADDRTGMILGNGASLSVLQAKDQNELKPGDVELVAYHGSTEDSGLTGVSEQAEGLQTAISNCLEQAGIKASEVDSVVAHGAGTVKGDAAELRAYEATFGTDRPVMLASKWLTGHTLGAAGAINVAFASEHLKQQTLHRHPHWPQLDQLNQKRLNRLGHSFRYSLVVSMGFGGNQAVILLRRHSV